MEIKPVFEGTNTSLIVFNFNDEYSKYFAVALQSIIENSSKGHNYDIVALISDVKEDNVRMLMQMLPDNFSLRFCSMQEYMPEVFKNIKLKTLKYYSEDIYFRLFIPILFKNYEKAIYLDSDVVVEEDIANIDLDFGTCSIAAALDTIVPLLNIYPHRREHIKNVLKIKNENLYFNSGVLVFNLQNIDVSKYIEDLEKAFQIEELPYPDQDILNIIFQDKVKFLHRKWNFNSSPFIDKLFYSRLEGTYKEDFLAAKNRPSLIHYTSYYKPWNSNKNPNYESFWKYARKTPFYEEILYARGQASAVKYTKFTDLYLKIRANSNVVLWGASLFLKEFLQMYNINCKNIIGIVDSNPDVWNTKIHNYEVYSPNDISKLNPDVVIITIINADYYADIQEFLQNEGMESLLLTVY